MSSTVKCPSCNIVIDELLAYIQNKISIIDEDSLVKICISSFSSEQINRSKTLLFESLSSEQRKKVRKGLRKENRELSDIISLFKVVDPDVIPVFVARDLEKLPPITFDHLDVSKLLKDLLLVQAEIKDIKESYAPRNQLEDLRNQVMSMKYSSVPAYSFGNINVKRGGGAYQDSGPMGLSLESDSAVIEPSDAKHLASSPSEHSLHLRNLTTNREEGSCDVIAEFASKNTTTVDGDRCGDVGCAGAEVYSYTAPLAPENEPDKQLTDSEECKPLYVNVVKSSAMINTINDEWSIVKKRKPHKNKRFIGKMGNNTSEPEDKFRAADRKVPMFISNVNVGTLESDITS